MVLVLGCRVMRVECVCFSADVTTLDAADAEDAIDPVAWLGGDDGPQLRSATGGGKRDPVPDGNEPIGGVDDEGHEIPAGPRPDKRVAGGGGKCGRSRKCNHGIAIGGGSSGAPDLYG